MKNATLSHILHEDAAQAFTEDINHALWSAVSLELGFSSPSSTGESFRCAEATASKPRRFTHSKALFAITAIAVTFCFIWVSIQGDPDGAEILPDEGAPLSSWMEDGASTLHMEHATLSYPIGTALDAAQVLSDCKAVAVADGTLIVECLEAVNTQAAGTTVIYVTLLGSNEEVLSSLPLRIEMAAP